MHVVPARVHHGGLMPGRVGAHPRARIRQPGGLQHRQRVHVGTRQHGGPRAIAEKTHHPGAAHSRSDLETHTRQVALDNARRARLSETQLGIRVNVSIDVRPAISTRSHPPPSCRPVTVVNQINSEPGVQQLHRHSVSNGEATRKD